ncbi:MAG: hypothetical protein M0Z94_16770 [Dehalococcoidales bacterium]|nr:hypothetical protein [Dehalococcoidales bacterium]
MQRPIQGTPTRAADNQLAEELERIPYEPLLPVEKQLILWSLGVGVGLLVILVVVSNLFFTV